MPRAPKRRRYTLEITEAEEEDYSSSSSTCSSSFPSSFSSTSSSSCYPLLSSNPSTPEEEEKEEEEVHAAAGTPRPPQSSPSACAPPTAFAAAAPLSQSSSPEEEGPSTSRALPDTESLPRNVIDDKVADLVGFLLLKYRTKELTTRVEMLSSIIREHQDHFAVIFSEASECMQLVYGIDVKEVDPTSHTYVLGTNLGLTYDGMVSNEHSMPKTGLLILILSIIFSQDDCVPEEKIWEALNAMGVHAGMEHCIFGEPRELLTKVWVQEQYLEYRQVRNSEPARYEFLWGPRAHAETTKLKVLEFMAQINGSDPRSFPHWYEEALREEEQRAQARISTTHDTTAMASASSSAMSSSFFCPQ
ncbi:melanoma-associated antigen 10-like [Eptesicus fuscus]|uniref:melanoma-associated antigen 10-like n=1 Tax=Eptesicus fuscus TaxID=29078 RepID=UPI0024041811|nr:melanoma-associated antigen 10-like [Eptesicus fuscus]